MRRLPLPIAAVVLFVLAVAVYWPGLDGPFLLDDGPQLLASPGVAMTRLDGPALSAAWFGGDGLSRPLARLSFAFSHLLAGERFSAFAFKLGNALIHGLNAVLVLGLCLRLFAGPTRRARALAVASLWAVHPIQLTAVLYTVQRATSLSAACVLLGLLLYVIGRQRLAAGDSRAGLLRMAAGLAGGTGLGVLCKENAVLLPLFALLLEVCFFRATAGARAAWRLQLWVLTMLCALGLLAWIGYSQALSDAYLIRPFTPLERLLTETRVLWVYLALIALPRLPAFGLFHDDIAVSTGLLSPWTTAPSAAAWLILIVAAVPALMRGRIWAFAVLWFVVGHLLESTVIGLEIAFEHRNYLPSFGPLLAAVYYGARALEASPRLARLVPLVAAATIAALALTTLTRAHLWRDSLSFAEAALHHHPLSSRAHGVAARARARAGRDPALVYATWQGAARLNPAEVLALVEMAGLIRQRAPICSRAAVGLTGQVATGALSTSPSVPANIADAATVLSGPLACDEVQMQALETAVHAEIAGRLTTTEISATTTATLAGAVACVKASGHCAADADTLHDWLRLAMGNPASTPAYRAALERALRLLGPG